MPVRPILIYPDARLKQPSAPVASFDQTFDALLADLLDTMYGAPGCVGIASPQIGEMHRVIIIDASRSTKPFPNRGQMILI
ncbi:MAG: peptide deformylase, partial [Terriglobales bacterium]